jgi:flagellar hook-associated protein 1 FlgK
MTSTFFGIELARRGLLAHRRALETTGHNIANVNTPGYSRQEVVLSASNPLSNPAVQAIMPGQIGTGVGIEEIRRIKDNYLDRLIQNTTSSVGYWEDLQRGLARVEAVFPEPSDFGLQSLIMNFFGAWHDLSQNPGDPGVEAVVKGAGQALATGIRFAYNEIHQLREDMIGQLEGYAWEINSLAERIRYLNEAIARVRAAGGQPNDLLDARDALLEELAGYAAITVVEDPVTRTVNVDFGLAVDPDQRLVSGAIEARRVELALDASNNPIGLNWEGTPDPVVVDRGRVSGALAVITSIDDYAADLNTLAGELISLVNDELVGGLGDEAQAEFFAPVNEGEDAAGVIRLGDNVDTVLDTVTSAEALSVAQLVEQKVMPGDTTILYYYGGILAKIGSDLNNATQGLANQEMVLAQSKSLRESVSGVSLDEEMTRMFQYQYGYQAAARLTTVLDELLDTLINRMAV